MGQVDVAGEIEPGGQKIGAPRRLGFGELVGQVRRLDTWSGGGVCGASHVLSVSPAVR